MSRRVKTAILISGRGSNMEALIQAAQSPEFPASIDLVISNCPDAAGLDKASLNNVDAICVDHKDYPSRRKFEAAIHERLTHAGIELICCAGFMRILTPWFVKQWPRRILNIHPSLLPKYKGLNTHQRALDAGDKEHGCTVHWVSAQLDSGDIITQKPIIVSPNDDADTLASRLLKEELVIYPQTLEIVSADLRSHLTKN